MFQSGLLRVLFLTVFALVAGLVGYQIGLSTHIAESGATVVYTGGGGWPGFGSLFFLFLIGFILFAFSGRRRHSGGGWGPGYGRGPWGGSAGPTDGTSTSDPRRQWVADMHRSLHEAESKPGQPTDSTGPTTPPTPG